MEFEHTNATGHHHVHISSREAIRRDDCVMSMTAQPRDTSQNCLQPW